MAFSSSTLVRRLILRSPMMYVSTCVGAGGVRRDQQLAAGVTEGGLGCCGTEPLGEALCVPTSMHWCAARSLARRAWCYSCCCRGDAQAAQGAPELHYQGTAELCQSQHTNAHSSPTWQPLHTRAHSPATE